MYRRASSDVEVADDEVGQLLFVRVGDFDALVRFHLALGWRPVLDAHHLFASHTTLPFTSKRFHLLPAQGSSGPSQR